MGHDEPVPPDETPVTMGRRGAIVAGLLGAQLLGGLSFLDARD